MCKILVLVGVISFLAVAFNAAGADLVLKNGKIYKNYRVKSVLEKKVIIAFILPDGGPDIAEINIADLDDDTVKALGLGTQTPSVNSPAEKIVAQIAGRLKSDLAVLNGGDSARKQALLEQASEQLKKELAPFYSDAEFETVWNAADGVIAKVIKINSSALLKENEKVFIRSSSQLSNRFRALVYATGCVMKFGSNEILPVFAFDEGSAAAFALKSILAGIGDKSLTAQVDKNIAAAQTGDTPKAADTPQVADTPQTAATVEPAPPVQLYPQYRPMPPVQPIVNNYYIAEKDEDGEDDEKKTVRRKRRRSYPVHVPVCSPGRPSAPVASRPPQRPEHRPEVRPESSHNKQTAEREMRERRRRERQENNQAAFRPGRRPSAKDRLSKNKSIVQRDKRAIHSYDHLPDWAQSRYSR